MPNAVTHPTPQELAAFALGKLPERTAAPVSAHLDSCPKCRETVVAVPPDSFLGKVRAAGPAGSSFPPRLTPAGNALSSAGGPVLPVAGSPDYPPELLRHPKFHILRELGRGGMGVVYLARQMAMSRQVVIKVVNRSLLNQPGALDRFRLEVQAAAQLSHPNIVTAYDAEQAGELHMLVMEFVPGQSLAEALEKKGPLPVASACHYVRQVAAGLQHAHERGMVHRDIKPSNLMLMPKGQVKILDFGLAKLASERRAGRGLTASDAYMGTPEYCAPEQAIDARRADIRADLYSLGCTLYCLLAGCPPFREDTAMKTILAHIEKQPQPLSELRPDVPERLCAVVARLLAKDPAQRYQKPVEVVQALAPFVKPGAGRGPAPSPDVGSPPREVLAKDETSPFADLVDAPACPREGARGATKRGWYRGRLVLAGVSLLLLALVGMSASGVFKVKTKDGTIVLKNLPADADVTVDGEKVTVRAAGGKTFEVRVDPGKKHRIEVKKDGIKMFGEEVEIDAGGSKSVFVRLEPGPVQQETKVAASGGIELVRRIPVSGVADRLFCSDVSPGGKYALVVRDSSAGPWLDVFNVTTGEEVFDCPGYEGAFLNDEQLVVADGAGRSLNTFRVYNARTGKLIREGKHRPFWGMLIAAGGKHLAYNGPGGVYLYDLVNMKELHGLGAVVALGPFSPDGKRLLFRLKDGENQRWIGWDVEYNRPATDCAGMEGVREVFYFFPDGKTAAVNRNGEGVRLELNTGKVVEPIQSVVTSGALQGAYSRDSRCSAVRFHGGRFLVYRTPFTGKELGRYELPPDDHAPPRNDGANRILSISADNRFATLLTPKSLYVLRLPALEGVPKSKP